MSPTTTGDTSPAVTATMASSSSVSPAGDLAQRDQRAALAEPAERHEVAVAEPLADRDDLLEDAAWLVSRSPSRPARRPAGRSR